MGYIYHKGETCILGNHSSECPLTAATWISCTAQSDGSNACYHSDPLFSAAEGASPELQDGLAEEQPKESSA